MDKPIIPRVLEADGLSMLVYPAGPGALYAFGGEKEAQSLLFVTERGVSLVMLDGLDWDRDLTPWPAPKAFKSGADFGGGANAFLKRLERYAVPAAEGITGTQSSRLLAGYSLAGLFSLYSVYASTLFTRIASVSGSLWYDGFTEFMAASAPLAQVERVYLSVGDREKHARSPRLGRVEERTYLAADLLRAAGLEVSVEINRGGHFNEPEARLAAGALAIL